MDEEFTPAEETEEKDERDEKSISSDLIRGHINTIILRSLYDGDKYGYEIIAEIERKSHGQYTLKQPSLYSALKRLEKDGYITSYWGGSVSGGRRKYFSLTDEGKTISEQNQSEWEYSRTVIDSLISDKDFDFSNPAPTLVNMRVLRGSTSRVPSRDGEEEEFEPVYEDPVERARLNEEYEQKSAALEEQKAQYEQQAAALTEEYEQKSAALEEQKAQYEQQAAALTEDYEQKYAALEEQRATVEHEKGVLEADKTAYENEKTALEAQKSELERKEERFREEVQMRNEAMRTERDWRERELAERERAIAEERSAVEKLKTEHLQDAAAAQAVRAAEEAREEERRRILEEEAEARKQAYEAEEAERRRLLDEEETERRRLLDEEERKRKEAEAEEKQKLQQREAELNERELFYTSERNRFAEMLRRRDEQLEEERRVHAQQLVEQEQRIMREQETLFRQREQQLIHQNYLDLVSTPPAPAPAATDYTYYTPPAEEPVAVRQPEPAPAPAPVPEEEYRSVVQKIYAGTVQSESSDRETARAQSLEGIDFHELESRAAHDGIRITTAGGSYIRRKKESSDSLVHKGKALFLSAIVVFFICVAEGSIALAVGKKFELPFFYPYFIWAAGLALLLVTGLAYANRYGERSLRRPGPVLINVIVIYALLVIAALILALAIRIDFSSVSQLATYIIVPVIFFFGIVIFGICYYLQTRPKKS